MAPMRLLSGRIILLILSSLILLPTLVLSEVLTPPYFNLAENRRITATATCGEAVPQAELYCKLVGANADRDVKYNLIQGQVCDVCDPNNPGKWHPPQYAIDGSEKWWQSPPLSRGMQYNQVNLTVDLGQLFQVAYVLIKMGNSPRPGIWVLERSVDNGLTYSPWQYFADSPSDCEQWFGKESLKPIVQDDDVTCTTQFSKVVPLEGGEIVVSLLNERPSSKNFFNSSVLQEFTRATNVRLRFLRTKTLLGHLMSVERQDPTVTRRYFYSVKDISIGGRCVCNGHAGVCDIADPSDPYQLQCRCQHNTCGTLCEVCCPGYIQKKWRPSSYSDAFVCEPCNCHGHSEECVFDEQVNAKNQSKDIHGEYEGGGVCQNCRDNTEGINCEKCVAKFYRPSGKLETDVDACHPCRCYDSSHTGNCEDGSGRCECRVEFMPPYCDQCNFGYYDYPLCKPCDCFRDGTKGGICEVGGGQCPCEYNYKGLNCDQCKNTYYGFPECNPCNCSDIGSTSPICDQGLGQCNCISNFGGQTCDRCDHGYYNHPTCEFCNCDAGGTTEDICDKETGQCLCREGYSGSRCDNSAPGFWGYPLIRSCDCHSKGSVDRICDADGYCRCFKGYSGSKCDQCRAGYFKFPDCETCNCDRSGSNGDSCDEEGNCYCKYNFAGKQCEECRVGFYIFPRCEECNCNPSGVIESFGGCDKAPEGSLCVCKPRVRGRICDQCEPLFWNLQPYNPDGCEECSCNTAGTVGGLAVCNSADGQCICKPRVTERQCSACKDGSFNLMEDNLFGCLDCGCNRGGSMNSVCNKVNGNCQCRPRVMGQRCDQPIDLHYFPTFHHFKYEAEDGRTTYTDAVRFGYDEAQFPGYSWRGFAIFSELQKETLYDVVIERPSLYRLILKYRNPHEYPLMGKVTVTPESPSYTQQEKEIMFPPTPNGPELMTVQSSSGVLPVHLVMDPGHWTMAITSDSDILLDYFVLLPSAYYEGTILTHNVTRPCLAAGDDDLCVHYGYPDVRDRYPYIWGSAGYVLDERGRHDQALTYDDGEVLSTLDSNPMAWLTEEQSEVHFNFGILRHGPHVVLLNYFTPNGGGKTASVVVEGSTTKGTVTGRALLHDCGYSWTCRQVVMDLSGQVGEFNFDTDHVNVVVRLQQAGQDVALESVAAVPLDRWHADLVTPRPVCVSSDGHCTTDKFPLSTDTAKVEFESNDAGKSADWLPAGVLNETELVYLNQSDAMVDVAGKLRAAGDYVFVVHYYQPYQPGFTAQILVQNGKFYEGSLALPHCPGRSGCRAVIAHTDGQTVFSILENFVLTVKVSGDQEVWLDYLLVVPSHLFSPPLLDNVPRDTTAEFISKCGQNHFQLSENTTGFCRDAVFALTVEFNGGAVYCDCDYYGSYTIECEVFGGACPCKPNVIGRRCDRCKTGYFGFPNCQPCDCPSTALCNVRNGECICPPLVQGERCDQCVPNTYGFDSIIGCEECQCSPVGVRSGNLQCDRITGQCHCLDNVVGRRCERCKAGYWTYPLCQSCDCDIRGTEADICNQNDASCYCKGNVDGRTCDSCVDGSYNLEETNPDGCTRCFCFGKTSACSPSKFFWGKVYKMTGWSSVQLDLSRSKLAVSSLSEEPVQLARAVILNTTSFLTPREEGVAYLAAPDNFLGNRITSYGGVLAYTLQYLTDDADGVVGADEDVSTGDVVLYGDNVTARYYHTQPLDAARENIVRLRLTERNFRTLTGLPMSREQFMMLLHRLTGVFIRSQYSELSTETRLADVTMDEASTNYYQGAEPSLSVEQCRCPVNYQGTSCEECAPGFFRAQSGPFGGFCVPCQCNRHSDTCDAVTGVCQNCQHNTVGEHCELCGRGFHGDATGQTPNDCLLCACPIPALSNNFADSCTVEPGRPPICECQQGYTGQQCQQCAPGHFGNPRAIGSYCQTCRCNDNIDATDPDACDDISGLCLRCLNHTAGQNCEVCEDSYYGDAVHGKDCRPCECNLCGTRTCDHRRGTCTCHLNVVGEACDECAPDHWGLDSCQGCQPCQCGVAAVSSQCDLLTGACQCQPGAVGRYCDRCQPGYWNMTPRGCRECTCRKGFSIGVGCDPRTGVCSCLPGVKGENCDGCPHRWVLIDGVGCHECPHCIHTLLDSAEQLEGMIMPTINEFESAAHSFFLHQRLNLINESAAELRPPVEGLQSQTLDSGPLVETLDKLGAPALLNNVKLSLEYAGQSAVKGTELAQDALSVLRLLGAAQTLAGDVVAEINALVIGLEIGTGAQLEQALKEGAMIVSRLELVDLSDPLAKAEMERETAKETHDNIKNFSLPLLDQQAVVQAKATELQDMQERVADIEEYIAAAQDRTTTAVTVNDNNRKYGLVSLTTKLQQTQATGTEVVKEVVEGQRLVNATQENFDNLTRLFRDLAAELGEVRSRVALLNVTVDQLTRQLEESQLPAQDAADHTAYLLERANQLDSLLADTRAVSQSALTAANAYINIVSAIGNARKAAEEAEQAGNRAVELSSGVRDDSLDTFQASEAKGREAERRARQVEEELQPQLEESEAHVGQLRDMTKAIDSKVKNINGALIQLSSDRDLLDDTPDEIRQAQEARRVSDAALATITEVADRQEADATVARQAFNDGSEARKSLDFATHEVGRLEKDIPKTGKMAEELLETSDRVRQRSLDLSERLEKLRMDIQKTRELSNKVRVGVDFQADTTVEVIPPADPSESATSTRFSLYTRSEQPSGLLLFMGTPVGGHQQMRRTKTDDFMALEIVNGFARLTMDLGSGPDSIENRNVYLSDGVWRKISVERTGMVVRLNVHHEDNTGTERVESVSRVLPGRFSVLNLSPKVSRVFVGGIPGDVNVDNSIQSTSYQGQVEEVKINGHTIGLWNFLTNGTANIRNLGAIERNRLVDLVPPTGLRFGGTGYASMNTRDENAFHFMDKFDISLKFKTFSEEGLIFLLQESPTEYLALSVVDGHVVFQLNLGSGVATLQSREGYSDGQWHRVEAARQEKQAILKVDGQVSQGATLGGSRYLRSIPDAMYFGGYPGEHNIRGLTNTDLTGCIDDISLSQLQFDLSKSTDARNTQPGCPAEVATLVSFEKHSPGYVRLSSPEGPGVKLVFKFRTTEPDGLLFYTASSDRTAFLTLALDGGALMLKAAPGGEITTGSFNKYNDSEWHVVIAAREHNELRLDIDDYDAYELTLADELVRFNGPVYFGGVPSRFAPEGTVPFVGCIGDATLNGKVMDFSDTDDRPSSLLQSCDLYRHKETVHTAAPTHTTLAPSAYEGLEEDLEEDSDDIDIEDEYPQRRPTPRTPLRYTQPDVFGYYDETTRSSGPAMSQCGLPIAPDVVQSSFSLEDGARFGNKKDSRIEYSNLPDALRGTYKLSLNFKTFNGEGIIFYAASISHTDYTAIYMTEGKVYFSYNTGSGKTVLTSTRGYRDDAWHSVVVEKDTQRVVLHVDGVMVASQYLTTSERYIEYKAPYFFGGLHANVWELARANTDGVELSFNGCLRAFRMNDQRIEEVDNVNSVSRCSDDVEPGVFFGPGKRAHVILRSRYSVGHQFHISMEVKPRVNDAVLMSIHGRRDFLMLQLKEGSIEFSADNGKGIIKTVITPKNPYAFCDGNWHTFQVAKVKNLVVLTVDGVSSTNTGSIAATSTDTRHPLFLGSQPRLNARRGQPSLEMFVGCIKNVTLDEEHLNLSYSTFVGNVNTGSCPVN